MWGMSKPARKSNPRSLASATPRKSAYEAVTDRIIAAMEAGTVPWHKSWATGGASVPVSIHGHEYRGINAFVLGFCSPYASNVWLTYNQARERGGYVRKGEKGTAVLLFKTIDRKRESTDEESARFFATTYTVFNIEQCEGVELPAKLATVVQNTEDPIAACEAIAAGYAGAPAIKHGGDRACYIPLLDQIRMPVPASFESRARYYNVLFHELGHSTGHASRLDRELVGFDADSHAYSKEELIAELTAALLCNRAGIDSAPLVENSAAYLRSWLGRLKDDRSILVQAASAASKAADWITGRAVAERAAA